VELVFSPFDMETIHVRWRDTNYGLAIPHTISRHTHPKARPETEQFPPPATGIDYLQLTAAEHTSQLAREEPIGYQALFGATRSTDTGQIVGQTSIDDLEADQGVI